MLETMYMPFGTEDVPLSEILDNILLSIKVINARH